jgi:hypothetical protein
MMPCGQSRRKWSRPPENVLKVNVDGAFFSNEKDGSWGFLLRDSEGDMVMAGRGKVNNLLNVFHPSSLLAFKGCRQQGIWVLVRSAPLPLQSMMNLFLVI